MHDKLKKKTAGVNRDWKWISATLANPTASEVSSGRGSCTPRLVIYKDHHDSSHYILSSIIIEMRKKEKEPNVKSWWKKKEESRIAVIMFFLFILKFFGMFFLNEFVWAVSFNEQNEYVFVIGRKNWSENDVDKKNNNLFVHLSIKWKIKDRISSVKFFCIYLNIFILKDLRRAKNNFADNF